MTIDNWLDNVTALPEIIALTVPQDKGGPGLDLSNIRSNLNDQVGSVIHEVSGVYEWDFALATTTTVTVANQHEYTLEGANQDCMNVANIRWGDDDVPVAKTTAPKMDDYINRRTPLEMQFWLPAGRSASSPIVRFEDAPATSGETIRYRYWRNDVDLGEFPAVLDNLLIVAMAKRMIKAYQTIYRDALSTAVAAYDRGGGGADVAMIDPQIVLQNNRRAVKHGW